MPVKKIAALGEREGVLLFRSLGVEVHPVSDPAQARSVLRDLLAGDYALVLLTEHYAQALAPLLDPMPEETAVVVLPGPLGLGRQTMTAAMVRAVGADIL